MLSCAFLFPPSYPNLMCVLFRSHGDVSCHVQVSLDPEIDHSAFRVYSGFGQQLGPIVLFGADRVIDGLAAFYPKTVVRLMALASQESFQQDVLRQVRQLQFAVSRAEEFIVRTGIIGIREGIIRKTGLGVVEGGRLPLKGRLPEQDWTALHKLYLSDIEQMESTL
jgi:2-keto-3-deoxy-L-rhamnonate aldolase